MARTMCAVKHTMELTATWVIRVDPPVSADRTIKNVIHDVTTRLNLRNRSHAVAYAVKAGIV